MEKETLIEELEKLHLGIRLNLSWDRGNGALESIVSFEGFDKEGNPQFCLGDNFLSIEKIGGYTSLISVKEYDTLPIGLKTCY